MGKAIAYQNKDITSKFLAEQLKGKSFRVYGLDLPEIQDVLPTNIPVVQAKELRLDNLFLLSDGSVALVDYESRYNEADKVKYLNYLIGIANRYLAAKETCPRLRMIVIYTGDIRKTTPSRNYDLGALQLETEVAFLSELDSEEIFSRLQAKVAQNKLLEEEELMEFIILPLSYRGKKQKKQKIKETVDLASQITDPKQQLFTLAGLLTFTDKLIDRQTAKQIRRTIEMTQVAMIFEQEKQEAIHKALAQNTEKIWKQASQKYEKEQQKTAQKYEEEQRQLVLRMIKKGYPSEEIASLIPDYPVKRIEALRKEADKA